jgi:hypothetical protein
MKRMPVSPGIGISWALSWCLGLVMLAGPAYDPRPCEAAGTDGARFSSDVTVRGIDSLDALFMLAAREMNGNAQSAQGSGGEGTMGALCILLDPAPRMLLRLGDPRSASEKLMKGLPGSARIGFLRFGDDSVGEIATPEELARGLLLPQVEGGGALGRDILSEVRRGITWLDRGGKRGVLLVITEPHADTGRDLEGALRAAKDAGAKVLVAGPEAVFTTPLAASLNGPNLWRRRSGDQRSRWFCESKWPELSLYTFFNLGGAFMWEPAREGPENVRIVEEGRVGVPEPTGVPGVTVETIPVSYHVNWPEDVELLVEPPEGRGGNPEAIGFPPIPSGFGFWHLTRLAADTGGKYFIIRFRESICPFRVSYDARKLAAMSPRLEPEGTSNPRLAALGEEMRGLTKLGVFLEGPECVPGGGVALKAMRYGSSRVGQHWSTVSECETEVRSLAVVAGELETSLKRLAALRAGGRSTDDPDEVRTSAMVDVARLLVARARFHVLARRVCLEAADGTVGGKGPWGSRGSGLWGVRVKRRVCRFWDGIESAKREVDQKRGQLSAVLRGPADEVLRMAEAAMDEWSGTPVAAAAKCGALWEYRFWTYMPVTTGAGGDVRPLPEEEGGPPTPTSSGSGTGTGR